VTATVLIIATGGANIASLQFALDRLGANSHLSADAQEIESASHVILPGVGDAQDAMSRLRAIGLDTLIPALRCPVLGICLGMQLLFESSAECLGILPGRAEKFPARANLPVPHMGWNTLKLGRPSPLTLGLEANAYAYFVHSYAAPVGEFTVATTDYGGQFSACVQRDNFFGAQFHPERSSAVGAKILQNFLKASP
jgi:imidazole glycerol-phosphate synthase subunit HisH